MMFFVAMVHRVAANAKSQYNHTDFKTQIMNNINSKEGKTG
jgi:hypothetical protein